MYPRLYPRFTFATPVCPSASRQQALLNRTLAPAMLVHPTRSAQRSRRPDKTKTLPGLAKVAVATALTTQASATKPTGTPSTADINNAINDVSECSIFVVQLSYKEIQGAARRLITQPFNVAERIFSYKKKQYLGVG